LARAPDERVVKAQELYKQGLKLIEIASQLSIPEGTVRSWKNRYEWDNATLQKGKRNVAKRKGGQPGNKNSVGHAPSVPEENKNAEKHGFFSKWLPQETMEIMQSIQRSDPLDLLWDNIQLQHTAIIRAQKLMYVKDQQDKTVEKVGEGFGNIDSEKWEVQQAWDKHATFLQAQSRAMKTLESMIKQYDELLHKNWDLATEEQRTRVAKLKVDVEKATGRGNEEELTKLDEMLAEIKKQAGDTNDTKS
jgi:phage terminase small subunit